MDASLVSSTQFEEFRRVFLQKHQQLVDKILKESCTNAIEAITRQTYSLIGQNDAAGSPARGITSDHKLPLKPCIPKGPTVQFVEAPSEEEISEHRDTLLPVEPSFSVPAKQNLVRPSIIGNFGKSQPALSETPANLNATPSIVGELVPLRGGSIDSQSGKTNPLMARTASQNLVKKSKIKASMRKSLAEAKGDDIPNVQRGLFADGEAMKEKLRLAITQPVYDVTNYYYKTGYCQAAARSALFENSTLIVIALNALWISIDTDLNDAALITNAHPVFQVADNLFCTYFSIELLIRFCAFERKRNTLKDAWFVFDTCMCLLMVFDTWLLPMILLCFYGSGKHENQLIGDTAVLKGFRLVRLVRMARVLKLLNALPELMVVIKGLFVATRAVSCTVLLMLLIIYVFAITFRQITSGTELGDDIFHSVPATMRYLLVLGTMPDIYDYVLQIWNEGVIFALIFLFFVLIVTITVMNMLVGVLVGVVNTVASVEKEQLMIHFVKDNLLSLLKVMHDEDADHNQNISKDEFRKLIQNVDAIRCFTAMGVDVVGLVDLADFIFQDGQLLHFSNFMDLIMQLRGSNQATVKDIVDLRRFITMEFNAVLHALELIPHDTSPSEEVSKVVQFKRAQSMQPMQAFRKTMSVPISSGTPPASQPCSHVETGILEPLVDHDERDTSACNDVAGENVRKKKLKRKSTFVKLPSPEGPFETSWDTPPHEFKLA